MANYLIWDWNGTLLDDVGAAVNALNRMLALRGVGAVARDYYRAHFRFPVRPFYAELGVDLEHEDWDAICEDFHRFIAEEPQTLRPDAQAAVAHARSCGFSQCILSALREDILKRDVAGAGLAGFFDFIYGVDNLDGATKRMRGHELARRLRLRDAQARLFFVGDTLHDAEVAEALGGTCILIGTGHQTPQRLSASGCPVVSDLMAAVTHAAMLL